MPSLSASSPTHSSPAQARACSIRSARGIGEHLESGFEGLRLADGKQRPGSQRRFRRTFNKGFLAHQATPDQLLHNIV